MIYIKIITTHYDADLYNPSKTYLEYDLVRL